MAGELPFEWGFLMTSRLAQLVCSVPLDAVGQMSVVARDRAFSDAFRSYAHFLATHAGSVPVQRTAIAYRPSAHVEHARDEPLGEGGSPDSVWPLWRQLIVYAGDLVELPTTDLSAAPSNEAVLAYMLRAGDYFRRPNVGIDVARAFSLYVVQAAASREDAKTLRHLGTVIDRPIDHRADRDRLRDGRLCGSVRRYRGRERGPPTYLDGTSLRDRSTTAFDAISGDRSWVIEQFGRSDRSSESSHIAWENTPFRVKPFVQFSDGRRVMSAPRFVGNWLSDGVYHRLYLGPRKSTRRIPFFPNGLLKT